MGDGVLDPTFQVSSLRCRDIVAPKLIGQHWTGRWTVDPPHTVVHGDRDDLDPDVSEGVSASDLDGLGQPVHPASEDEQHAFRAGKEVLT